MLGVEETPKRILHAYRVVQAMVSQSRKFSWRKKLQQRQKMQSHYYSNHLVMMHRMARCIHQTRTASMKRSMRPVSGPSADTDTITTDSGLAAAPHKMAGCHRTDLQADRSLQAAAAAAAAGRIPVAPGGLEGPVRTPALPAGRTRVVQETGSARRVAGSVEAGTTGYVAVHRTVRTAGLGMVAQGTGWLQGLGKVGRDIAAHTGLQDLPEEVEGTDSGRVAAVRTDIGRAVLGRAARHRRVVHFAVHRMVDSASQVSIAGLHREVAGCRRAGYAVADAVGLRMADSLADAIENAVATGRRSFQGRTDGFETVGVALHCHLRGCMRMEVHFQCMRRRCDHSKCIRNSIGSKRRQSGLPITRHLHRLTDP